MFESYSMEAIHQSQVDTRFVGTQHAGLTTLAAQRLGYVDCAYDTYETTVAHEYGCVMLLLPDDAVTYLRKLQRDMDPADVVELEGEHHVTVLYGLHEDVSAHDVGRIVNGWQTLWLNFTQTAVFPANENRPESDCVYVEVTGKMPWGTDSEDCLSQLNATLRDKLSYTNDKPFRPHATVAYVKPGTGSKYAGLGGPEPKTYFAQTLEYCDTRGRRTTYGLL